MYIKKLKLKNYRNYKEVEVEFDKEINIFYGNNAEGKTNLLESIYLTSTAKSHKNTKEKEIINFNEQEAHIKIIIDKKEKQEIIDIQLNKDTKKGIALNGVKIEKLSDFLGSFNVIIFAPEDLYIIKEGPMARRKFIDILLCQIDKIYVKTISNYNKVLNQRNTLLRDINQAANNNKNELKELLDTYDLQIVDYGIEIIEKRKRAIDEISKNIFEIHYEISNHKEKLFTKYENDVLDLWREQTKNIDQTKTVKEIYLQEIKNSRDTDIKNQFTLIGPHRDDISFTIDDMDIRKFGSQGQKKTAAISLKLSELALLKQKINDTPVLLLDDVFSELDETRQELLVKNIKGIQTIITCTGIKKNVFELLKPNKIFFVNDNQIIEKK